MLMGYNAVMGRNIYPSYSGQTVAEAATGAKGDSVAATGSPAPSPVDFAVSVGSTGNIAVAGIILIGLVWLVTMLAERYGGSDRAIKGTLFNVMVVGLMAAVGTPIWKYFATRFPIPGASAWILAG